MATTTQDRTGSEARGAPPTNGTRNRTNPTFYWMVAPALILFFVLHTWPLLQGVFYSFTNYAGYGEWDFVGLSNYAALFRDDRVLDAYIFTFLFAIVATILTNAIALSIAVGLNANIRWRNTLRGIFFLPNVLPMLVVGYVFSFLFASALPVLGQSLGIEAISSNILGDEDRAWIGIVVVAVWQAAAFNIILYLAGLQTIPTEVYEAASIDGANPWRRFWTMTFPLIAPFFTINMVLALKNFLMIFDHIVALTNGGPGNATTSISLLIYRGGFQGGEFAYQTANAVVYLVVIVVLSMVQLRFLQRREVAA